MLVLAEPKPGDRPDVFHPGFTLKSQDSDRSNQSIGTPAAAHGVHCISMRRACFTLEYNMKQHPTWAACASACMAYAMASVVWAESAPSVELALPEQVVTANRIRTNLADTVPVTQVYTSRDWQGAQDMGLAEWLAQNAGLAFTRTGGAGQTVSLRIRGAENRHTLVLVDGERLDSATSGSTALERLNLTGVERIEVVRGGMSGLYGADALGGVIQIFTRRAQAGTQGQVSLGAGNHGTYLGQAELRHGSAAFDWVLAVGTQGNSGPNATRPSHPWGYVADDDASRDQHVLLKMEHRPNTSFKWGASYVANQADTDYDAGSPGEEAHQSLSLARLYAEQTWSAQALTRFSLAQARDRYHTHEADSRFNTEQNQLHVEHQQRWEQGSAVLGLESIQQKVVADTAFTHDRRQQWAGFASGSWHWGDFNTEAAVRHDHYQYLQGHWSGQLGISGRINPEWRWFGRWANAFKAPSFNDLYWPFTDYGGGYSYSGNPELKPERGQSYELGLGWQHSQSEGRINLFQNEIRDLIAYNNQNAGMPINIGHARIRGVETLAQWRGQAWSAGGNLTYQQAINQDSHAWLRQRARWLGQVHLNYRAEAWQAGATWQVESARYDSLNQAAASRMGGYGILNLHARYQWSKAWAVDARLENLFDRDYTLVQGYTTPGRQLVLLLNWTPRWDQ